jgi:DNA modification methylase
MRNDPLPRLDENAEIRDKLLRHCRLRRGDVWIDPMRGHRVGCVDATNSVEIGALLRDDKAQLAIQDPPYNLVAFEQRGPEGFINWCEAWIRLTLAHFPPDASLYVWLGADQNNGFQPLPDFMLMMRRFAELETRSFITMRNQRGYGTQQNWMAIRQELLYYVRGKPPFAVQYTEIPKILRGYYKEVNGSRTENLERSKSENIRPGNVWVDIQQVFYRMEENVSGCYAQKPLKAIDRIVAASSTQGATVLDFFAHSGTTLLSCERLGRQCLTCDIDPIYCEITIRRLERFRGRGLLGWQNGNPFEIELARDDVAGATRREDRQRTTSSQASLF